MRQSLMANQSGCTPCQLVDALFSAYTTWVLPRSAPATYCTSGISLRIASTSPSDRVKKLLEDMRTPPAPRPEPGERSSRCEPRPDTSLSISCWVPCPTHPITLTAALPVITPSEVRALRI